MNRYSEAETCTNGDIDRSWCTYSGARLIVLGRMPIRAQLRQVGMLVFEALA